MTEALVPRSEFPVTGRVTYLDAANDGLVPASVRAAAEEFWRASSPGEPGYGDLRARAYEGARDAVAELLGADRRQIAVTTSASEALGQVAWGLELPAGANVVVVDVDFPTVTYPWLRLAGDRALEVRTVTVADDLERLDEETVASAIDEDTAVVSVSHVQFATGHRLDLRRLADAAHAHGALLAVDAAQSAGVVPIDVAGDGVDVLVGHGGKWLGAETGAAFCFVTDAVLERLQPPVLGWRSTEDPWDIDGRVIRLARDARRLEISSVSYVARFVLAASIRFLLDVGIGSVEQHSLRLGEELAEALGGLGAEIATPAGRSLRAGIVAARWAGQEPGSMVAALRERGVQVSARGGWVRFSAHLFNDSRDVERAVRELEALLDTTR